MRDIFYGRDIPILFPKPDFWAETSDIESDEIYTIDKYSYCNKSISFAHCRWLFVDKAGGGEK